MSIESGNHLYWYETRCRAGDIKAAGERAWKMRLACEGEGENFRSTSRISIAADGRLVIENGPLVNRSAMSVCVATARKHDDPALTV